MNEDNFSFAKVYKIQFFFMTIDQKVMHVDLFLQKVQQIKGRQ